MPASDAEEEDFSDEDLEEIIEMKAPKHLVREFEAMVKERPLLLTGLVFAFGLLVGVSISGRRRRR